ncbi:MAG: polysaccharide deacetylase family protein [Bryobacterales bacterium]
MSAATALAVGCSKRERPVAVLTFDDAVKSHRSFVAPLLSQRGFGATFFITHRWMEDKENFLNWDEVGELYEMGFEIGNHSWTHIGLSTPRAAALLEPEIALLQNSLAKVGVPNPKSFAWCGNAFGPEAFRELERLGFRFARRGMQPEQPYGKIAVGPAYQPERHHPLLIPTTGDAYPDWTLEHFRKVLDRSSTGLVVLQFHGVPDIAHPWVHTSPERFEGYMQELADRDFDVIAMRDLERFLTSEPPADPLSQERYPETTEPLRPPVEVEQTRAALPRWMTAMRRHGYSRQEAQQTAWLTPQEAAAYEQLPAPSPEPGNIETAPYPGGARHPRIGFLDGAIAPLRGPKLSVFLPWDPSAYLVLDLPELITSTAGHQFLAHTHVPTIWNEQNVWIENVDSTPTPSGGLSLEWALPNGVVFGSKATPGP